MGYCAASAWIGYPALQPTSAPYSIPIYMQTTIYIADIDNNTTRMATIKQSHAHDQVFLFIHNAQQGKQKTETQADNGVETR